MKKPEKKRKQYKFKWYKPKTVYWLIRANISYIPELKVLELTGGILGYGILFQIYFRKWRTMEEMQKAADDRWGNIQEVTDQDLLVERPQ